MDKTTTYRAKMGRLPAQTQKHFHIKQTNKKEKKKKKRKKKSKTFQIKKIKKKKRKKESKTFPSLLSCISFHQRVEVFCKFHSFPTRLTKQTGKPLNHSAMN
jgi:hypothetical protein